MKPITQVRTLGIVLTRFSKATGVLITRPVVQYKPDSVVITMGYVSKVPLSVNLLNVLSDFISKWVFGIKTHLYLVRVQNHYADAYILAQYLSTLLSGTAQTSHTFKVVIRHLVRYIAFTASDYQNYSTSYSVGPLGYKGLRVQVSGRLATEPSRPRQTVSIYSIGSFKSGRVQASSYTATNPKGSITIKV